MEGFVASATSLPQVKASLSKVRGIAAKEPISGLSESELKILAAKYLKESKRRKEWYEQKKQNDPIFLALKSVRTRERMRTFRMNDPVGYAAYLRNKRIACKRKRLLLAYENPVKYAEFREKENMRHKIWEAHLKKIDPTAWSIHKTIVKVKARRKYLKGDGRYPYRKHISDRKTNPVK